MPLIVLVIRQQSTLLTTTYFSEPHWMVNLPKIINCIYIPDKNMSKQL
uniref:Uncharacterized protein n=1 Tax=Anguilla anguilla TaxID=7936 RepID=A0A0E9QGH2_ANGAN